MTRQMATTAVAGVIVVTMLPVDQLFPSGWNPNKMAADVFAAYQDDVRLKGKIPKPVVVVRDKSGYRIVDGEHGWRVAKEVGLTEIPCEIIDADRFEAMHQTISRNLHGENDPVLLGRLYRRMMEERKLSNRALAAELHVTEGTIRHYLSYVEAAALRNSYAPTDADDQISRLTFRQITTYLSLPTHAHDEWLDGGASQEEAARLKPPPRPTKDVGAGQQARPAEEIDDSADADSQESETVADAAALATPADQTPPKAATLDSPEKQQDPFDPSILDELEEIWNRANKATRQKFLAAALADPHVLAIARCMIKQGA